MATSKSYWQEREEAAIKNYITQEEAYVRAIEDIYSEMIRNINREIEAFYGRYATKEGISISDAKKRVKSLDIEEYAEKAKKYVKEKNFSELANAEMRLYNLTMKINRLELLKAQIGLEMVSGFDELNQYFDEVISQRTLDEFKRQAGILGNTLQDNAKYVHSIVNASFHNATFSERIWANQNILKNELSSLLSEGLIQGKNPRDLARSIRKVFNTSIYNSERLMRTELARVQTEAQRRSFIENGFGEYTFHALGNACEICKDINGKHFKVDKMMPGDNAPPMHPNCRCSTAAYVDEKAYNDWLDGYKEHGLSFQEWKNRRKLGSNNNYIGNSKPPEAIRVGKLDDVSDGSIRKTLEYWESKIIDQNFETAIIITKDGDIYRIDGDKNTVNINGLDNENLSGAWMTHNHPEEETRYSFSAFDISEALRHKFSLLRGVDKVYTYEYKTTPETIDSSFDQIYNLFGEVYRNKAYEAALRDEIDIDFDEYDYICKLLAKDYHFDYERKRK